VVLERGFAGVSARELAAEIGISPGLLHHYFSSMDEIMGAAVELFAEEDIAQLEAAVDPGAEPLRKLDQLLRFFAPIPGDRSCQLWVDAWMESRHNRALRQPVRRLNDRGIDLLELLVREAVADGDARTDDPRRSALLLGALLDGLTIQVVVLQSIDRDASLVLLRHAAELELGLVPGSFAELARALRPARRLRTSMGSRPKATERRPNRAKA
jgi:AcrR family transcriptional regulator